MNNICLLCKRQILKSDDSSIFKEKGWDNLKQHADIWKDINIPSNDKNYNFKFVNHEITNKTVNFGRYHKECRINFRLKCSAYIDQ